MLPSPRQFGYRHRARLHAAGSGGAARLGFFRAGSHIVVPLESCPVLHPALDAALGALAATLRHRRASLPPWAEVRADTGWDGSAVRLALRGPGGAPLRLPPALERTLQEAAGAAGIAIRAGGGGRPSPPLSLGPGDDALVTTGPTFTQVNLAQNQALVETALDLAAPQPVLLR